MNWGFFFVHNCTGPRCDLKRTSAACSAEPPDSQSEKSTDGDKPIPHYAIELKYPRNGQHPEQMFSFCKDITFAEELVEAGSRHAAVIIFADDPLFYRGRSNGIYGYFRGR